MNAKLSRIFLGFSILILISTIAWLLWPSPYRVCHIIVTGMGRGNLYPKIAKFKPYKGKEMGGASLNATVIKEETESFVLKNEPYCFLSLGAELSGTVEAYMTKGMAVTKAFDAMNLDAMLVGNIDFAFSKERLAELSKQSKLKFVTSNVWDSTTNKAPDYLQEELILNLDQNLCIGILGLSPVDTPSLTAKEDISGLTFVEPSLVLKKRVDSVRNRGADIVVLLTQYNKENLDSTNWKTIASASPDICLMLDTEIEAPIPFVKDGVIVYSISSYNQTKELDFLNLEITKSKPIEIVGVSSKRIGTNSSEYEEDSEMNHIVNEATKDFRAQRDTVIGTFSCDVSKSYYAECSIANMVTDSMLAETGAEIAFQNSGSIHNDISEGGFTIGNLYSVMPFDNRVVTMDLKGIHILELLKISASRRRGVLQVAGLKYSYSYKNKNDYSLIDVLINGKPVESDKFYKVVTNSFLADGGDDYLPFTKGINMVKLGSQRDLFRNYITLQSQNGSIKPLRYGRIKVED